MVADLRIRRTQYGILPPAPWLAGEDISRTGIGDGFGDGADICIRRTDHQDAAIQGHRAKQVAGLGLGRQGQGFGHPIGLQGEDVSRTFICQLAIPPMRPHQDRIPVNCRRDAKPAVFLGIDGAQGAHLAPSLGPALVALEDVGRAR